MRKRTVTQRLVGKTAVLTGNIVLRFKANGLVVEDQCLVCLAQGMKRVAEIVERRREGRIEVQRCPVVVGRLLKIRQLLMIKAAPEEVIGIPGIQADCFAHVGDRVFDLTRGMMSVGPEIEIQCVAAVDRDCLVEVRKRLVEFAKSPVGVAAIDIGGIVAGFEQQGSSEIRYGLLVLSEPAERQPPHVERLEVSRVEPDRLSQIVEGQFVPFPVIVDLSAPAERLEIMRQQFRCPVEIGYRAAVLRLVSIGRSTVEIGEPEQPVELDRSRILTDGGVEILLLEIVVAPLIEVIGACGIQRKTLVRIRIEDHPRT